MRGFRKSKGCGCLSFHKKSISSYEDESTSSCRSSEAEVQVRAFRSRKIKPDGGLLHILLPRNLFKGWRRNDELSMTKIERKTFDDANSLFKTILEQNSGSDSTHNVITRTERTSEPSLSDELVENANCNDGSSTAEEPLVKQQTKRAEESTREKNKQLKMSKPQYSKGHNQNKDSSNDYEIEMLTAENNTKNYGTKTKVSCQVDSQTHNSLISSSSDEEERVTPQLKNRRMQYTPLLELSESSSRRSTPLRDSIHNVLSANYQEKIIKDLESLKAIQEQHSIVLQEILATVRTKNVQALTRPADTPDLPIDHKKEFSTFESWLENPTNLTYMRSRLAAVGGSTVRGATMNVMKYLITNKIGMRFNWAGSAPKDEKHQRKYPFKDTKMFALINAMKAAILIQRWYRRYLARMEVRRRYTWTIFQSIEYAGEQDQVKLYNFFNALLTHIPETTTRPIGSAATSKSSSIDLRFEDESDEMEEEGMQHVDRAYRGIHINFPMKRADLDALIDAFRKRKQHRLHARYVAGILKESIAQLKRLPNLNQASTAISKQVTICGDLHGKLDDLLVVFHKNGLPSAENPYVFNGDFVDRGKKGLEVLLLLLSCMLVFPGGVFLNRGNHEDHIMNSRYGFVREVQSKYRHNGEKLLKLIEGVYRWLPLGTIVNNKVLIVHGGISDTTDLDLIKSLDRGKYVSLLRPPITESTAPGAELIDKVEWKQVFDILWSDPQPCDGCIPNGLRGAGTYFGPDVSKRFLKRNKMMYLIRSHECKPEGYEISHNNKVITVFSASNYYELGSNKGAYLKLVGPQLDTHFVQYTAATGKTKRLTFRQRIGLVESSAIRELRGHIISNREILRQEFEKGDPDLTGFISVSEWCRALEAATELALPWRMLRDKLVALEPGTQMVKYSTTFDKINDSDITTVQGANTVVETLYRNKSSLEAIFRIIDKDNSGFISLEEFSDACNLIREHMPNPISHDQLLDMCRLMDMNKDGLVDLNEFLETFRMVDPEQQCREARLVVDDFGSEHLRNTTYSLPGSGKEDATPAQQTPKEPIKPTNGNDAASSPAENSQDLHSSIFGSPVHNSVCQNSLDSPLLASPKASSVTVTITNTSPVSSPNSSSTCISALDRSPVVSNRHAK